MISLPAHPASFSDDPSNDRDRGQGEPPARLGRHDPTDDRDGALLRAAAVTFERLLAFLGFNEVGT